MTSRIVGRSSSHFTRTVRMFAHECGVAYRFEPVLDLASRNPGDYAGNPALRIPIFATPQGTWFGALNICRELVRRAPQPPHVVWPERLDFRQVLDISGYTNLLAFCERYGERKSAHETVYKFDAA
jgi:glutathione S-transferase